MPDTGLKRSPKFQKGAFVQLVEDIVGVIPNVIPFQYNPEKLSHSLIPRNLLQVKPIQLGAQIYAAVTLPTNLLRIEIW